MKLSENFHSDEFACRCGCGLLKLSPILPVALEKFRALCCKELGRDAPVLIDSGCRCERHNAAEGGKGASQHLLGSAVDCHVYGLSTMDLYRLAVQVPEFRGFGVGFGRFHADVRPGPIVRWRYDRRGHVIAWPEERTT